MWVTMVRRPSRPMRPWRRQGRCCCVSVHGMAEALRSQKECGHNWIISAPSSSSLLFALVLVLRYPPCPRGSLPRGGAALPEEAPRRCGHAGPETADFAACDRCGTESGAQNFQPEPLCPLVTLWGRRVWSAARPSSGGWGVLNRTANRDPIAPVHDEDHRRRRCLDWSAASRTAAPRQHIRVATHSCGNSRTNVSRVSHPSSCTLISSSPGRGPWPSGLAHDPPSKTYA